MSRERKFTFECIPPPILSSCTFYKTLFLRSKTYNTPTGPCNTTITLLLPHLTGTFSHQRIHHRSFKQRALQRSFMRPFSPKNTLYILNSHPMILSTPLSLHISIRSPFYLKKTLNEDRSRSTDPLQSLINMIHLCLK